MPSPSISRSRTRRCLRRLSKIDDYISRVGLAAPTESIPRLLDGYQQEELTELNLQRVGISTVMWATGYAFDFSFVKLPVVDSDRYPIQKRGVSHQIPRLVLSRIALVVQPKVGGILFRIGDDAAYPAAYIAARDSQRREYNTRSRVLCDVVDRVAKPARGLTSGD